ncbi:UNVERIFIED_CONTAM: hypothetical protein HHA_451620 [Hammondia hammondi]|eukprot:XP_008884457.1 hypothetical protein HHA_451620 [Hammondia hammondi]
MQNRLTRKHFTRYLAAKAARGRAQIGGDSSPTAVGEAAVGARTSPPAAGESPTPGDAGSLDALDKELARQRQLVSFADRKTCRVRQALKKHLEHPVPSPTAGVPSSERERAGEARAAWEGRRLQLEQNAKQARETAIQCRAQLRALNAQKVAYEKAHGFSPGRRGGENASLRFSRLGITVDERESSTPWYLRPNFIGLSHCSSGGPTDPAARRLLRPRHHVVIAGRQHASRLILKHASARRARARAAERGREKGAERKASTSTSGHARASEFQCTALYMGLTNPSSTVATRWQSLVM